MTEESERKVMQSRDDDDTELDDDQRGKCPFQKCILLGGAALLTALILILAIGFGTGSFGRSKKQVSSITSAIRGNITNAPSAAPSSTATSASTQERAAAFAVLFSKLTFDGGVSFKNSNSSESLAVNWIVNEDPLQLDPNDLSKSNQMRIAQRYGLSTLYYNTASTRWTDESKWLSQNECEWFGVTSGESG